MTINRSKFANLLLPCFLLVGIQCITLEQAWSSIPYRLLLAVCFSAFLAVGLIGRAALWRWRVFGGAGFESRSVWHEALTRAHATAPYAFMC